MDPDRARLPQPPWCAAPAQPACEPGRIDVWRFIPTPEHESAAVDWHESVRQSLREVLARYTQQDPSSLDIVRPANGKPHLANNASDLRFNLSHCRDLALLAVTAVDEVGIDVETHRPLADPLRIARRVFPAADIATLEAAAADEQSAVMLRLWTGFEARQKTRGLGIFGDADPGAGLHCHAFLASERHVACVCTTGHHAPQLRFFDI